MLSRRVISTYRKPVIAPPGEITYLGKDVLTGEADPNSGPVTIPASADAIIVFAVGNERNKVGPAFFDELNFDDGGTLDFIHVDTCRFEDQLTGGMFIMTAGSGEWPGPGPNSIYWGSPGADVPYSAGLTMVVSYWSGMHQTDPIRDSEIRNLVGLQPVEESSLSGVISTDMAVGVAWSYQQIPDPAPAGYGQTSMEESIYNRFGIGVHYELGESVMRFENLVAGDGGIVWGAIKAA